MKIVKHAFWGYFGLALLITGLGALTMIGGLLGIPTIFVYTSLSGVPNYLQMLQIVLSVLGAAFLFAGVY